MAFITTDGSEAPKDSGQIGMEDDGSQQGVQAISLKEGLGRRANRLGGAVRADCGTALVPIGSATATALCATAGAAGLRQHLVAVSLALFGGTAGTDWAAFTVAWSQDDGAHAHTVYLPAGGYANLVFDGGGICTVAGGGLSVAAQGSAAAGQKALASICAMSLPG